MLILVCASLHAFMHRDASHLWRSFSHNRTKNNIQFLKETPDYLWTRLTAVDVPWPTRTYNSSLMTKLLGIHQEAILLDSSIIVNDSSGVNLRLSVIRTKLFWLHNMRAYHKCPKGAKWYVIKSIEGRSVGYHNVCHLLISKSTLVVSILYNSL